MEVLVGEATSPLPPNTPKRRFVSVAPVRGRSRAHRIELTDCPQPAWLAPCRKRFTRESLRRTGRAPLDASSATGTAQAPSWLDLASLRPVGNRLYRVSCSHIHSASARLRSMAVCFARSPSHLGMSALAAFFLMGRKGASHAAGVPGMWCVLTEPRAAFAVLPGHRRVVAITVSAPYPSRGRSIARNASG